MPMQDTLIAVIIIALIFLFGYKVHLPGRIFQRGLSSFSAGVAIAYVFIHLIPELDEAKNILMHQVSHHRLSFSEYIVYLSAMLGFIAFYGLEKMVAWPYSHDRIMNKLPKKESMNFFLHLVGYAIYVCIMSYLMVRNIESDMIPILFYIIAMGFHFLCLSFYFYDEHYQLYIKIGRYLLAAAALIGWAMGVFSTLHKVLVIIFLSLVSGAIIMNTMLMELPKDKAGKFLPFLLGSMVYALLLVRL